MSTAPASGVAIVGRSVTGRPRTYRVDRHSSSPDAAYRRLTSVILRLDVASLGREMRAERLGLRLPQAA